MERRLQAVPGRKGEPTRLERIQAHLDAIQVHSRGIERHQQLLNEELATGPEQSSEPKPAA